MDALEGAESIAGLIVVLFALAGTLFTVFNKARRRANRDDKIDQMLAILSPNGGESIADRVKESRDMLRTHEERFDHLEREVARTNERLTDAILQLSTRPRRSWDQVAIHSLGRTGTGGKAEA